MYKATDKEYCDAPVWQAILPSEHVLLYGLEGVFGVLALDAFVPLCHNTGFIS